MDKKFKYKVCWEKVSENRWAGFCGCFEDSLILAYNEALYSAYAANNYIGWYDSVEHAQQAVEQFLNFEGRAYP